MRSAGGRRQACAPEEGGGPVPALGLTVVQAERELVRLDVGRVHALDRLRHAPVEQLAPRLEEAAGDRLPDAIVGEVEALAHAVQDPVAHQLFQARGGGRLVETRRPVEETELELATDDRRDGDELSRPRAEPIEAALDHLADPVRQRHRGRRRAAALQRAHRFDHHERVAFTRRPHELPEGRPRGLIGRGAGKLLHQDERVLAGKPGEGDRDGAITREILEEPPERRRLGRIVVPSRDHEQDGPPPEPAAEKREQPDAHVVGPVQILEDDQHGLARGEALEQAAHGLEEVPVVRRPGGGRSGRQRQLGKEPRQFRQPAGVDRIEHFLILVEAGPAQRIDPDAEGQHALPFIRPSSEDPQATLGRFGTQFGDQTALADARLADERHDAALPAPRAVHGLLESRHRHAATDQRRVPRRILRAPRRRHALRARAGRTLPEQFLVEPSRRVLGHRPQLSLERVDADLVLTASRARPPQARIEPHERAVDRLLQGVEGEEAERSLDRRLRRPRGALVGEQPPERVERHLSQPLALEEQPLLEGRLPHARPGEEVALVEGRRAREIVGAARGRSPLELRDVDIDRRRLDGDCVALEPQSGRVGGGQRLAEREEGLPQAGARLGLWPLAPQQRRELVPGVGPARRHRQIRQQRLGLPGRQDDRRTRRQARLKAAEESEREPRHSCLPAPLNTG